MTLKNVFGVLLGTILALNPLVSASASDLSVKKVAENVYAIIGQTTQRSAENLGNNANFGVIVTNKGLVLVDPGGSFKGARHIAETIKSFSGKKVIMVIDTGGQDHRWIGNDYFFKQGAEIHASKAAVEDQQERSNLQFEVMENLIGKDNFKASKARYATETFDKKKVLNVGGTEIELIPTGGSHTPGDVMVWLPESRIVFSSDLVYMDRILGIADYSDFSNWIPAFKAMAALGPRVIVPGHGMPGNLAKAKADTYDYLVNLRDKVKAVIDSGGVIADATKVDQDKFKYLENFDQLAKRNAQQVFIQLEFE